MRRIALSGIALLVLAGAAALAPLGIMGAEDDRHDADAVRHGRYLVQVAGCNDCHTPGYILKEGTVPEERWLIGDSLGFRGPWGTTYPANLRGYMGALSEDEWVENARTFKTRPPMPWFNLRVMSERDLRAIHRYVRSLPPDDSVVPDYVPPEREPRGPYFLLVPQKPD